MSKIKKLVYKEKSVVKFNKLNHEVIHNLTEKSVYLTDSTHYTIFNVHLKGSFKNKLVIIDDKDILRNESECALKRMTNSEIKKLVNNQSWYEVGMKTFKATVSIDPKKFMKENDWENVLNLFLYENCSKDKRLVEGFKSVILPLPFNPGRYQPLNNHQIWFTNTGTGKTTFNSIMGNEPNADLTEAGLFGGNLDNYNHQQKGILNGDKMLVLDELSTLGEPVLVKLLGYLEQGQSKRLLKVPVLCEGVRPLILTSNPFGRDIHCGFLNFMEQIFTLEAPARMGRRFGFILLGVDFKPVNFSKEIVKYRGVIRRLIHSITILYKIPLRKIYDENRIWCLETPDKYITELKYVAEEIPYEKVSDFVKGNILGMKRIRMGVIRALILENLDSFVLNGSSWRKTQELIEKGRDLKFDEYYNYNLSSFRQLSLFFDEIPKDKKLAVLFIKNKYPNMSHNKISTIIKVTKQYVSKILSEKGTEEFS